jgi:hypothetical protein
MKIYFDGCSWTYGTELENKEQERFSRLLCNDLSAEETNLACPGGSNQRIIRNLITETDITQYDLAVIQLTYSSRTEFHDGTTWRTINVNPRRVNIKNDLLPNVTHQDFWEYYYTNICNDIYFKVQEKIAVETITHYCKSKNVPLILMSIDHTTELNYDLILTKPWKRYPSAPKKHPTREGHKMITKDILNIITSRQLL